MNNKPLPPLSGLRTEYSIKFCPKCSSSIKINWWFKELGCIQPQCDNYYKRVSK